MLGVPSGSKPTWISRLAAQPIVHDAIRVLRVQRLVESALAVHPIKRRLPHTGGEYRFRFLESFLVADEIFAREMYREAFEGIDVRTFVDLGSNVGYFSLYALERTRRRDLVGLAVDANEAMTGESRWHIENNGLTRVEAVHGLVGYPPGTRAATFYLNPSNIASSAVPVVNPDLPVKGRLEPVTVPAIDLVAEWRRVAGDARIDLMKIDLEGFECDFIKNTDDALELTDRVVLEWHKWINQRASIDELLAARGFVLRKVIAEDAHAGSAIYDRRRA